MQYHLKRYETREAAKTALENIQWERDFQESFIVETPPGRGPMEYLIGIRSREGRMLLLDEDRMEADWIDSLERHNIPREVLQPIRPRPTQPSP